MLSTTTGYQTRSFGEAAESLGIELVFATDRCHQLDDPWRDRAVAIRFHEEDEAVQAIVAAAKDAPISGVLALGDRPTVIAARAAEALGLPGNPPAATETSRHKRRTREALSAAGLAAPWFRELALHSDADETASVLSYPCIVKPLGLSGSRGVIRVDTPSEFVQAFHRVRRLLGQSDVRALRDPINDAILVEGFIHGTEVAVEGLLERGRLRALAIFDKPDPLDGPYFEETIYVTPTRLPPSAVKCLVGELERAVEAIGLIHGPVHAECRMLNGQVTVLEVAARPIGGLCARALAFCAADGPTISFEELLLRHAVGEPVAAYARESAASGVMMVPIPQRGVYRGVEGLERARDVAGVTDVRITAKVDQTLVPLPEGASYLGFIFAKGADAPAVEHAIRTAHGELRFKIDRRIEVVKR